MSNLLYNILTSAVVIDYIPNIFNAIFTRDNQDDWSNKIAQKLKIQNLQISATKYTIRYSINAEVDKIFGLESYECDRDLYSTECSIQLGTSFFAGTLAGIYKAYATNSPWWLTIPDQIGYDICNKFESCSDGVMTLPFYVGIETLESYAVMSRDEDINYITKNSAQASLLTYAGLRFLVFVEEYFNNSTAVTISLEEEYCDFAGVNAII